MGNREKAGGRASGADSDVELHLLKELGQFLAGTEGTEPVRVFLVESRRPAVLARTPLDDLADDIEVKLLHEYGPLLTGTSLKQVLAFGSQGSVQQAIKRRAIPFATFPIKNRRGRFALTRDAARWLAQLRTTNTSTDNQEGGN